MRSTTSSASPVMSSSLRAVDLQRIETSIMMLKQYLVEDDISPLIDVLESIAADPRNEALHDQLSEGIHRSRSIQPNVMPSRMRSSRRSRWSTSTATAMSVSTS